MMLWLATSHHAWSRAETTRSPYACASSRRALEDVAAAALGRARGRMHSNATVTYPNAMLRRARRVDGFVRFVATHHKTGTALTGDVFSTLAKNFSYAFFDARAAEDELARRKRPIDARRRDELREIFDRADIVFDYHFGASVPEYLLDGEVSEFDDSLLEATRAREYRVAHVVRDPLDVLVSGALYHRRAPPDEDWLTSARDELQGNTIKAFLAAATPAQAVNAEWRFSGDEIRMLALTHEACERDERCLNVRLEDFESNFQETIDRALRFLGFPRESIAAMKALVAEHDTKTWSTAELAKNEHYTRASSDRAAFYRAVREDAEASRIIEGVRRAMGYA